MTHPVISHREHGARHHVPDPENLRRVWSRPGKPARVLLIGNYGNGNSGDESILAGLLQTVPAHASVVVVTRNPERVRAMHHVAAVQTLSWGSLRHLIRSTRLVVGGGGMFGRGLPLLVGILPAVLLLARLCGKQVAFAAIGTYLDTPRPTRDLLEWASRFADTVTVRDHESATLMRRRRERSSVVVVGDPAGLVTSATDKQFSEALPTVDPAVPRLVVSLKAMPDAEDLDEVLHTVGSALRTSVRGGAKVVFLCMSEKTDYGLPDDVCDVALARRLAADYLAGDAEVVGPGLAPNVVRRLVGTAAGVISMRLHPQIFATACGTPQLPIVFEAKSRAWCEQEGVPFLDWTKMDESVVSQWLDELLGHRFEPSPAIARR